MAARVAVLASGRGSNLQALLDAAHTGGAYEIAQVVVDRPGAFALERAARAGIAASVVDYRRFADRHSFERELDRELRRGAVEWLALAGFMRVLTAGFVAAWPDRILNIHPSLLPAFKGLNTHRRALAAGVRIAGCTVHVVRPALDDGPIVAQAAVPVVDSDDEESLAARVLAQEHALYPRALALMVSGAAVVDGDRVRLTSPPVRPAATLVNPPSG